MGGIAGNITGSIENCNNTGKVEGNLNIGGIIGFIRGNVTKCKNSGFINGGIADGSVSVSVGGVVGISRTGDVSLCVNTGEVNGSRNRVGGVIGDANGRVSKCVNNGKVVAGGHYAGGVLGHITTTTETVSNTVSFCYNTGAVYLKNDGTSTKPGGVVGRITRNIRWRNEKLL